MTDDVQTKEAPTTTAKSGPNPVGDYIWYELMTPDPAGATAFYEAVVGWKIGDPAPAGEIEYRMIGRAEGGNAGGMLTITGEMAGHGARPAWLGYLYVADVDSSIAAIMAAGGSVHMPATDIPGIGRIAMVADPQGAPFYIMKPIPPASDPQGRSDVFSPDAEQRVGWNELSTSDPAAARAFYGDQFGWVSDDFMDMGEHGEYRFIDQHGLRIGAIAGAMNGQPPHWRFYFRVPSIAKAKDVIEAKGGKIAVGPMEVPGGDHILIGSDPQGAEFALVGKA